MKLCAMRCTVSAKHVYIGTACMHATNTMFTIYCVQAGTTGGCTTLCTAYLNSLTVKPVVPDINCCDIICADTKVTCHNNSLYITKISV
jgi:hypothetical protein